MTGDLPAAEPGTPAEAAAAEVMGALALRVKRMRASRGLTMRQLGELCGLNASTVLRAEKDGHVDLRTMLLLAAALEVPPAVMLTAPSCDACQDYPPAGFACRKCGAER